MYVHTEKMRDVQNDKHAETMTEDYLASHPEQTREDSGSDDDDEGEDEFTANSTTHSHTMSVTSLLAMKRDKIEKQRKQSVLLASTFAKSSKEDTMVNSMRTLNMIASRVKPVEGTKVRPA